VSAPTVDPTGQRVPLRVLAPLSVQHLLVMVAGPVSSAFLLSAALELDAAAGARLLAALLLVSGIGTALQSIGPFGIGARLPFVMLPGGAAVALFAQIAREAGPAAASGAVVVTGLAVVVLAPVFTRLMRFFPPVVLGTMIIVVGVNLVKINAGLVSDTPAGPSPWALALVAVTVGTIVVAHRVLPGGLSRLAVLLGIVAGAVVAAVAGRITPPAPGPLLALPEPFPFGAPELLLPAMVPLLLFSIGAMAEAAGQTVLTAEAVDRPVGRHDVTRTVRGDGVTSVLAGLLGGPLMVTSGENIGIVRLSRVRSRYVTVGTAVLLVVLSVCAPVARWVAAVPSAVVGAAGVVVFAMVAALGVGMVARSGLGDDRALMTATLALAAGLLPVLMPTVYQALPVTLRLVLGSGVTMAALVGALAHHLLRRTEPQPETRPEAQAEPRTEPRPEG
jgi:uracil-xanthine permease